MRQLVLGIIGFVGTVLDYAGKGNQRWERWRPSVGLCQQEDLVIHRLELLHDARSRGLFERLRDDIAAVSPETEVRSVEIALRDPGISRRSTARCTTSPGATRSTPTPRTT